MGRKKSATNRTVTSHGYILIWNPLHHLSDNRGYVYEHRLIMERKLGRDLLPNEIVHHLDENKQNNDPDNLSLFNSTGEHFSHHNRGENSKSRLPGEKNKVVSCACGCDGRFWLFDKYRRPRKYISGHNSRLRYGQNNGNKLDEQNS